MTRLRDGVAPAEPSRCDGPWRSGGYSALATIAVDGIAVNIYGLAADVPAQRPGRIDLLAEADELDVQPVQLVEDLEEMPGRACDRIARPDQDSIEPAAAGIPHQLIESRPACFHAGDSVGVFVDDVIAARGGHLPELVAPLAGELYLSYPGTDLEFLLRESVRNDALLMFVRRPSQMIDYFHC